MIQNMFISSEKIKITKMPILDPLKQEDVSIETKEEYNIFLLLCSLVEGTGFSRIKRCFLQRILIHRIGLFEHRPSSFKRISDLFQYKNRDGISKFFQYALKLCREEKRKYLVKNIRHEDLYKQITGEVPHWLT